MSLKDTLNAKAATETSEDQEALPVVEPKFYETLPVRYYGEFRILGSNYLPIPKLGDLYMPENEDHLDCLDYQVDQNRITMEKI